MFVSQKENQCIKTTHYVCTWNYESNNFNMYFQSAKNYIKIRLPTCLLYCMYIIRCLDTKKIYILFVIKTKLNYFQTRKYWYKCSESRRKQRQQQRHTTYITIWAFGSSKLQITVIIYFDLLSMTESLISLFAFRIKLSMIFFKW